MSSDVRLIMLGGKGFIAVSADLEDYVATARSIDLEENHTDIGVFVGEVRNDMDRLITDIVSENANAMKAGTTHSALFLKLLLAFTDIPVELIGNMLASMLIDRLEQQVLNPGVN